MNKKLDISNGAATDVDANGSSGTINGIAHQNGNYVLKYVIGV